MGRGFPGGVGQLCQAPAELWCGKAAYGNGPSGSWPLGLREAFGQEYAGVRALRATLRVTADRPRAGLSGSWTSARGRRAGSGSPAEPPGRRPRATPLRSAERTNTSTPGTLLDGEVGFFLGEAMAENSASSSASSSENSASSSASSSENSASSSASSSAKRHPRLRGNPPPARRGTAAGRAIGDGPRQVACADFPWSGLGSPVCHLPAEAAPRRIQARSTGPPGSDVPAWPERRGPRPPWPTRSLPPGRGGWGVLSDSSPSYTNYAVHRPLHMTSADGPLRRPCRHMLAAEDTRHAAPAFYNRGSLQLGRHLGPGPPGSAVHV